MDAVENLDEIAQLQDSFPKVSSSDGEPHEILTLIAISSGAIVAVIVLFFIGVMIDCRQKKRHQYNSTAEIPNEKPLNFFTIFGQRSSLDITKDNNNITTSTIINDSKFVSAIYINEKDMSAIDSYIPGITTLSF